MLRFPLIAFFAAVLLASCCEPAHKDSAPYVVNSDFQETAGRDVSLANQPATGVPDSAYYPIYTFGIQNTGMQDDDFTLQLRYFTANGTGGFDITRHVPAGQVVLFRTPTATPDSITANERFAYSVPDTNPNLDEIYEFLSFQSADSAEIHTIRPQISIVYGAIDKGPEGCNTPASAQAVNIDSLPVR